MNDRFKFRCFNKFENKMFDVRSMSYINGVVKRIEVQSGKGILIFDEWEQNIDNTILMQCTGLKDKNGKLIYEGDVVKFIRTSENKEYKGIITYDKERAMFELTYIGKKQNVYINKYQLEVIGNIYENPELLEVSK